MKKIIISFILVVICNSFIYSQYTLENKTIFYQKALKERIYLHYNSSFFLSGENLYYNAYCIKARGSKLSNLSKVAYVELLDSNRKSVFKHKIRLEKSVGDGVFFIPATLPSGNYKLIAYTQWMRNEGDDYYFQGDITIINPFQNNQNFSLNEKDTTAVTNNKIIIPKNRIKESNTTNRSEFTQITLKKKSFKKREKVELKIANTDGESSYGAYSISVRKIDNLTTFNMKTSKNYTMSYPQDNKSAKFIKTKAKFLPEFKGELLTGKVINKKTLQPAKNIKVILSIPNKKHIIKFAITNNLGVYTFNLKIKPENNTAIIQVLDDQREDYNISILEQKPIKHKGLNFKNISLSPKTKELILNHNIQNQIKNAYFNVKYDTLAKNSIDYIDNLDKKTYILDDFNRFSTVKETVIEIINNVWIAKRRKKHTFHVRNNDPYDEGKFFPLVFIDGFLTQNHNELVNYNTKKIKSISVVRGRFTYKSYNFQGIISMKTFDGDYKNEDINDYIENIHLLIPLKKNEFYNQKYVNKEFDRIPDYRKQLLWLPNIDLSKKDNSIVFYTSDINGEFEICLEGFNHEGKPVSLNNYFTVE